MVTRPPPIIASRRGSTSWSFSSASTTSTMTGRSLESRSTLSVWSLALAPKPAMAAHDGRAGAPFGPQEREQDRLVEGLCPCADRSRTGPTLAEEDPHERALAPECRAARVRLLEACGQTLIATAAPTPRRPRAREPPTRPCSPPALHHSPSRTIASALVAEGAERRERAEEADRHELAELGGGRRCPAARPARSPRSEGARDVHRERAPRKEAARRAPGPNRWRGSARLAPSAPPTPIDEERHGRAPPRSGPRASLRGTARDFRGCEELTDRGSAISPGASSWM